MAEILPPLQTGGYIKPPEHDGHLVIFTAIHGKVTEFDKVRNKESDVYTVDWHCFNCGHMAPPERALLGAPYIGSKLRQDGNLTLGYIQILPPKTGFKDGPQVLADPNPQDIVNASGWWEQVKAQPIQGPAHDETNTPAQQSGQAAADPWAVAQAPTPTQGAPADVAAFGGQPSAPGVPDPQWGAPAQPVAPPPPPQPAAGPGQGMPSFEDVQRMNLVQVQALVGAGVLTAEQARQAGHQV